MIRAPSPITTGPRITERSSFAPAAIATLPSTRLASSSSHSTRRSRSSSTRRFASSMSASCPVSFHQPLTVWLSTREPLSIRCWIASVISSSPRPEGSIERAASRMAGVNM